MDVDVIQVIRSLPHQEETLKLLKNERNERIIHTGSAFYMINKETKKYEALSGLLPALKKAFWPNTDFFSTMAAVSYQKKNGLSSVNKQKTPPPHNKGRHFGLIRGSEVHQQLEDFILLDEKNFKKKHTTLHPWTKRILLFILDRDWQPLESEFNIFDKDIKVGTSIDMVCVDKKTGKLIILEFKTGYSGYFDIADGFMEYPLNYVPNTARDRAMLQLGFAMLFLIKHHRITFMDGYVIRLDSDKLECYSIDSNFLSTYAEAMYKHVYNTRMLNNKKRTTVKRRKRNRKTK